MPSSERRQGKGEKSCSSAARPAWARPPWWPRLSAAAFEAGACVLLGRCDEELGAPYQPFTEALGHFVAHGPEEQLRSHVQTYGPELGRMVPGLGRRLGSLPDSKSTDADAERYLLFGADGGPHRADVELQPVVMVLDDLQWADKPSLQLLRHVVARVEPTQRLLVVGIYRDSELSRFPSPGRDPGGLAARVRRESHRAQGSR